MTVRGRRRRTGWPRRLRVRDVDLYVDVLGDGDPVLLLHGGPGADMWTLAGLRRLADEHTLVFLDHRCNGRSVGPPVRTMTWENLVEDADALRERLGFPAWAVLGHSFGGHVALEYALRHPERVSRLVLLDTAADSRWARENAPRVLARRGYDAETVALVRRWFHGRFTPRRYLPIFLRIASAYGGPDAGWSTPLRELAAGGWRTRMRPDALIFAGRVLCDGWSVVGRLPEVSAPTLVVAGREDFVFPPESQRELADGIAGSRLVLVDGAGHSPHDERPGVVLPVIRSFLAAPGGGRPGA